MILVYSTYKTNKYIHTLTFIYKYIHTYIHTCIVCCSGLGQVSLRSRPAPLISAVHLFGLQAGPGDGPGVPGRAPSGPPRGPTTGGRGDPHTDGTKREVRVAIENVYVCMYVGMHVCMYAVCMFVCLYVCMYVCMYVILGFSVISMPKICYSITKFGLLTR